MREDPQLWHTLVLRLRTCRASRRQRRLAVGLPNQRVGAEVRRDTERFTYTATPNVSGHDWATQEEAMEDLRTALKWEKIYLTDYPNSNCTPVCCNCSTLMVCHAYPTREQAEEGANPDALTIERY